MTDPYRASLPVVQTPLVFCKDCRFFSPQSYHADRCDAAADDSDPVYGYGYPHQRNAKRDCSLFQRRRPWWRFW